MRPSLYSPVANIFLIFAGVFAPLDIALAQGTPPAASARAVSSVLHDRNLQLEVFINGASTNLIGAFRQLADGSLATTPEELLAVGLKPAEGALDGGGLIHLDRLTGISYRIDEAGQRLFVTAADEARPPHIINARPGPDEATPEPQRSYGGVLDYTLYASSDA